MDYVHYLPALWGLGDRKDMLREDDICVCVCSYYKTSNKYQHHVEVSLKHPIQ